jgi:hypothetical protein
VIDQIRRTEVRHHRQPTTVSHRSPAPTEAMDVDDNKMTPKLFLNQNLKMTPNDARENDT